MCFWGDHYNFLGSPFVDFFLSQFSSLAPTDSLCSGLGDRRLKPDRRLASTKLGVWAVGGEGWQPTPGTSSVARSLAGEAGGAAIRRRSNGRVTYDVV